MTLRKPFRAVPINSARRNRRGSASAAPGTVRTWLLGAALAGTAIGTGSVASSPEARAGLEARVKPLAVAVGVMRERAPQPGDYWPGCNAARAAGTAPIYRGEPGYRSRMDDDDDGIACEPYY